MNKIAINDLKSLEKQFDYKTEFKIENFSYQLISSGLSNQFEEKVTEAIKKLISSKKVNNYLTQCLPALKLLFETHKSAFLSEISNIECKKLTKNIPNLNFNIVKF